MLILTHAVRSFSTTELAPGGPPTVFSRNPSVHTYKLFHPGTSTSRRKPSYEISKGFPLVQKGFRSRWAPAGLETKVFHSLHRHSLHANSPSGSKEQSLVSK